MDNWTSRLIDVPLVDPEELLANPLNPRRHPASQRDALRASLDELGWVAPVYVNMTTGHLLDGHARVEEALSKGIKGVPVLYLELSLEEEKKMISTFDPITNLADYDQEILSLLADDVVFEEPKLEELFDSLRDTDKEIPEGADDVPAVDDTPAVSRLGEIYLLGEHRVMCGDSTSKEDVERLMDGVKADMVFTDPPYGVAIGAKNQMLNSFQKAGRNLKPIENDSLSEEELFEVLKKAFINVKAVSAEHMSFYVCSPQGGGLGVMMMMKDSGLPVRHTIIWVKNQPTFSMNRLDYDYQHEPILYGWNKKHEFYGQGQHKTSVWNVDKPREAKEHPTMKPIELMDNAICNSSKAGQIILDIFLGSGSTLIACEQTKRKCYGMELDPKYVDVIRKRWVKFVYGTDDNWEHLTPAENSNV